jgi:hypothetical protein
MRRTPVTSTTFRAVGYDKSINVLELEFHTGRIYQYFLVPKAVHEELMQAESLGGYFNSKIRDKYRYDEIKK